MAGYSDRAAQGASLPTLGEMFLRMKAKHQCDCSKEQDPGKRKACGCDEGSGLAGQKPADAVGPQQQVTMPGEAPIKAQPVAPPVSMSVGQPQIQRPPQYNVSVGQPQIQQMPQASAGQPRMMQQPPQNPAMDPRLARMRALMAQGISQEQAMRMVMGG